MSHAYHLAPPTSVWPLPRTGALLALCGLALLITWVVDVASPVTSAQGVRTQERALERPAPMASTSIPLLGAWADGPMAERDDPTQIGRGIRLLPSGTFDRAGAGPAERAHRASVPLPIAATRTQNERLARAGRLRDPRADLAKLVSAQRGRWTRPCPCPMDGLAHGER